MSVRDRVEYWGYRALTSLVRVLPLRASYAFAAFCGRATFALGGKHVRWALENLRIVYPDADPAELRRIGSASYESFARNAIDFVRAESWTDEEVRRNVTIVGVEHAERAFEKGNGVLCIGAHLGNFELMTRAVGSMGRPSLAIGRPMRNKLLYQRLERSRTRNGDVRLIERDRAALPIMRALKRNEIVGVLVDQYVRRPRGVFVPFFGVRCLTTPAPATLALRAGATLLCVSARRDGPDHHRVELAPIEIPEAGPDETPVEALTAACNRALEERIRATPEEWMWGHRRFRHSPDLDHEPYAR